MLSHQTPLSTGLGAPQLHTRFMIKIPGPLTPLTTRKAPPVLSAVSQDGRGPHTSSGGDLASADDTTNCQSWCVTHHRGQVHHSAGRDGASSPKPWGIHTPPLEHAPQPTRMATGRKMDNSKYWGRCGETGTLNMFLVKQKMVQLLREPVWAFLKAS